MGFLSGVVHAVEDIGPKALKHTDDLVTAGGRAAAHGVEDAGAAAAKASESAAAKAAERAAQETTETAALKAADKAAERTTEAVRAARKSTTAQNIRAAAPIAVAAGGAVAAGYGINKVGQLFEHTEQMIGDGLHHLTDNFHTPDLSHINLPASLTSGVNQLPGLLKSGTTAVEGLLFLASVGGALYVSYEAYRYFGR